MNAEKSLSAWLSRRNISVAGNADHSVIAFILTVSACSSDNSAGSKLAHGTSSTRSQRTCSNCWNNSGYNMSFGFNGCIYRGHAVGCRRNGGGNSPGTPDRFNAGAMLPRHGYHYATSRGGVHPLPLRKRNTGLRPGVGPADPEGGRSVGQVRENQTVRQRLARAAGHLASRPQ